MSGYNKPRRGRTTGQSGRGGTSSGSRPVHHGSSGVAGSSRTSLPDATQTTPTTQSGTGSGPLMKGDLFKYGLSYEDFLYELSRRGGSFSDLASLGVEQGGIAPAMNDTQRAAWNKQLLDQMLAMYVEQEKRGYNESWYWKTLGEQRLYDNPLNQLARLMGSGISRDAAIQMLSGSGSGSGGSSVPYGDAAALAQGETPTDSNLKAIQGATSIFGAIANVASGVGALGSFGLSAATLSTNLAATQAATAGQLLGNKQLASTLAGIDAASAIIGTIGTAVDTGFMAADHEFKSSQDMLKYIQDNAANYEPFQAMVDSGALKRASKDLYTLNALNNGYKAWRESRDYGIDRDYIVKSQALNLLASSVDIDKMNSEIQLNQQKINESIQNVLNSTLIAKKQATVLEQQAYNLDADTALKLQEYDLRQYDLDWLDANIDDLNQIRTNQIQLDAACWEELRNNPKAWRAEVESWLSNRENLRSAIAIESYYYGSKLQAVNDMQNPGPMTDQNFAKWVTYMHNLFTQAALPYPGNMSQADRSSALGDLSGSSVAAWALGKFGKAALIP